MMIFCKLFDRARLPTWRTQPMPPLPVSLHRQTPFRPAQLLDAGLDPATAMHLQTVALETVQDDFKR
jgi:hypothetical protein